MTDNVRNPQIGMLLSKAENDASVLALPLPDDIFGFHAQQSCEKLLKAWLAALAVRYPLTHSLHTLVQEIVERGETLPKIPFDLNRLEPYAVLWRYEPAVPISAASRTEIQQSLAILRSYVLGRIATLESGTSR